MPEPITQEQLLQEYEKLHDGLSDMVEGGRLREGDIPDDYQWLVQSLAKLTGMGNLLGKSSCIKGNAMGWFGIFAAIECRDTEELFLQMTHRHNPNDPSSALRLAVESLAPSAAGKVWRWAEIWMAQAHNDPFGARGDRRWCVMSELMELAKGREEE